MGGRFVALGVIAGAHGIRGQVKLRSFTANPHDITAYGPLRDAKGRHFNITITGGTKDALIATVEGITTREGAEALRNTELLVPRAALPQTRQDEYYHEDMIGLNVVRENAEAYGKIVAVHNFGAGDLIVVHTVAGEEEFQPFSRAIFPRIDLEKGIAVIQPPDIIADE